MSAWDVISGLIPGAGLVSDIAGAVSGVAGAVGNSDWWKSATNSDVWNKAFSNNDETWNQFFGPSSQGTSNNDVGNNNPTKKDDKQQDPDLAGWTSIRNKPFKFNPPLHSNSRPVRVDFGSGWRSGGNDTASVQKAMADYLAEIELAPGTDTSNFQASRLGRIVQSENAVGVASNLGDYRWGFRFLYNPEELTTTAKANMQVIIDTTSPLKQMLSSVSNRGPFQSHQFTLYLNRMADLEADDALTSAAYAPYTGVSADDIAGIRERGTMWDLEYLYRTVNGVWNLDGMGISGNIGMLQPNPLYFVMGPGINHYGIVSSVQYQHARFNINMVPTLTQVTIQFDRLLNITPEQGQEFVAFLGDYGGSPAKAGDAAGAAAGAPSSPPSWQAGSLLAAMHKLGDGKPYIWGATGPNGYDCSGLVYAAMKDMGIYTGGRFTTVTLVRSLGSSITEVSNAQVGDIILWSSHVGVIDGPGTMFNALNSREGIKSCPITYGPKGESYKLYRLVDTQ